MRLKSLTNDQTVPRYRYFNFYKPHKVDGKGFSSQMPTLKFVPSDQKSKRRTCAEECQMPFKPSLRKITPPLQFCGVYFEAAIQIRSEKDVLFMVTHTTEQGIVTCMMGRVVFLTV